MRLFVAIDIDSQTKNTIDNLQQNLQQHLTLEKTKKSDVKWVQPDNIHLTLKFLGEVEDSAVAKLCSIVENIANRCKTFDLDLHGLDHFGGKTPRVLWIGTGQGSEQLCRLQKDLDEQLDSAGWPKENRQFSGHLTLCRIRNPRTGKKLALLAKQYKDFDISVIAVDSLYVYQSQLTPDGPVYTVLGKYKLQ